MARALILMRNTRFTLIFISKTLWSATVHISLRRLALSPHVWEYNKCTVEHRNNRHIVSNAMILWWFIHREARQGYARSMAALPLSFFAVITDDETGYPCALFNLISLPSYNKILGLVGESWILTFLWSSSLYIIKKYWNLQPYRDLYANLQFSI